jgi:hypothetical protein
MYEHTLYDAIFALGFFGKLFFALAVFAVSLGMSLLVGTIIDPLTSARSKSEA